MSERVGNSANFQLLPPGSRTELQPNVPYFVDLREQAGNPSLTVASIATGKLGHDGSPPGNDPLRMFEVIDLSRAPHEPVHGRDSILYRGHHYNTDLVGMLDQQGIRGRPDLRDVYSGVKGLRPDEPVVVGSRSGLRDRFAFPDTVSGSHFSIMAVPHGFMITDLGSTNGTTIEVVGEPSNKVRRPGDPKEMAASRAIDLATGEAGAGPTYDHGYGKNHTEQRRRTAARVAFKQGREA